MNKSKWCAVAALIAAGVISLSAAPIHVQSFHKDTDGVTLTMSPGKFPGMLKDRTFRIVWVSGNHGVGIASGENADATVQYHGSAVTVSGKK